MPDDKPIGYWLKRGDEAITRAADELRKAQGLTRLHWQVFNVAAESKSATVQHVFETLRPFAEPFELEAVLLELEKRGWLQREGDSLTLSEAGARAHRETLERQRQLRTRMMRGVSEDEYRTVLRVLGRMVANLDASG